MNKKSLLVVAIIFFAGLLNAQSFSKSEQKVIDAVKSYWSDSVGKDKNAWIDAFHDSYKGWDVDNKVVSTKENNIKWINYSWGKSTTLFWDITPIGVVLHDDIAVVHYYYTTIDKDKKSGKETTTKGKWTDVILNDGGEWKLVADHGGKIESTTSE
tara:strand:+ start:369 stop:836 length:468 start_codon:yes stop_codon:yes gene_type:complete